MTHQLLFRAAPGKAIAVAFPLAIVPYRIARGLVTRLVKVQS